MKIQDMLYEKAKEEYDQFVEELLEKSPKEIVNSAYEYVTKSDILMILEEQNIDDKLAFALYRCPFPVSLIYSNWLKVDDDYMVNLKESLEQSGKIEYKRQESYISKQR